MKLMKSNIFIRANPIEDLLRSPHVSGDLGGSKGVRLHYRFSVKEMFRGTSTMSNTG